MRLFSETELDSDLSRYGLSPKQKDSVRRLIYIICDQYSKQIEKMKNCQNCKWHSTSGCNYCGNIENCEAYQFWELS